MAYQRQTLADLLEQLKSSWDSTPFWTDAEGIRYLNHALRFWNLLTGYWKRKVLIATSGTHYQSLPGSLTFGMQVVWGPIGKPLQVSALADLDCGRPRWEEELTTSGGTVPTAPQLWAPNSLIEIVVWPAPPAALPLLVDGIAATPLLADPADFVDADDYVIGAIVGFALHVGVFKRGLASVQATTIYLQDFIAAAKEQNLRLMHSTLFRKALGLDQGRALRPIVGSPAAPTEAAQGSTQG